MSTLDDIVLEGDLHIVDIAPEYELNIRRLPRVLTIAGSDNSGGAGIEADLKTMTALGCYGLTSIDALTVQNTLGVKDSIINTPSMTLKALLTADFAAIEVDVVKIGMLTAEAIESLPMFLKLYHFNKPIVMDTIISSTSGHTFSGIESLKKSIENLLPLVTLITPNFIEAGTIIDVIGERRSTEFEKSIKGVQEMARYLQKRIKCQAVLIKGGHIPWDQYNEQSSPGKVKQKYIIDILYDSVSDSFTIYKDRFTDSKNLHGTGCTLASAISSYLARGLDLQNAVKQGTKYVHGAIFYADETIGKGNGPLNHVWNL